MNQMNSVIEHALKMTSARIKHDFWKTYGVMVGMMGGEVLILLAWAIAAPLKYKRSCLEKEKGGTWAGVCVESLGKCRTTMGQAFVAILGFYHGCCILAGMFMCYLVRNLPSIMAEGKWVFTGLYSQAQVFVTAIPVLVMVKDQYLFFTILKSLVICLGDLTTLAMVFLPKMLLVYKYQDFKRPAISEYIANTMSGTTQRDHVYEMLRVNPSVNTPKPTQDNTTGTSFTTGSDDTSNDRRSDV